MINLGTTLEHVDVEDVEHLFFSFSFARSCWDHIGLQWNFSESVMDRIELEATRFPHHLFFETFTSVAWGIWKERNDLIFNGVEPSLESWRRRARHDFLLLQFRVKDTLMQQVLDCANLFFS